MLGDLLEPGRTDVELSGWTAYSARPGSMSRRLHDRHHRHCRRRGRCAAVLPAEHFFVNYTAPNISWRWASACTRPFGLTSQWPNGFQGNFVGQKAALATFTSSRTSPSVREGLVGGRRFVIGYSQVQPAGRARSLDGRRARHHLRPTRHPDLHGVRHREHRGQLHRLRLFARPAWEARLRLAVRRALPVADGFQVQRRHGPLLPGAHRPDARRRQSARRARGHAGGRAARRSPSPLVASS